MQEKLDAENEIKRALIASAIVHLRFFLRKGRTQLFDFSFGILLQEKQQYTSQTASSDRE